MRRVARTGRVGVVVALVLHAGLLAVLLFVEPPRPVPKPRRPVVKISLATRPKPEKPKPPEPTPPKPEPPKPEPPKPEVVPPKPAVEPPRAKAEAPKPRKKRKKPKPKPKRKKPARQEPPKKAPEKPAASEPPKPVKRARKFAVSMDATVPGSGVAVPTTDGPGRTAGDPDGDPNGEGLVRERPPAREERPRGDGDGEGDYEVTELTVLPKILSQPSGADMRRAYPRDARADGREADVKLKLLVSAKGRVVRVRVVSGAGYGFDEAAKRLARRMRFRPAKRGGRPVSVWIPWTYKFRLDS